MNECDCYNDIFLFVKEYAESKVETGEAIDVSLNKGKDCYISIEYNTIINKKHIEYFEHLSPHFLNNIISRKCVKLIIDDIIEKFRSRNEGE